MIVTRKAIPRRAMLRGLGATVALPFLDAMVPAFGRLAAAAPKTSRLSTIYIGNGATPLVAEPGQEWDAVLLVRYPSREAFSRMVADPEYQQFTHFRTQALTEAVLQPTTPW